MNEKSELAASISDENDDRPVWQFGLEAAATRLSSNQVTIGELVYINRCHTVAFG